MKNCYGFRQLKMLLAMLLLLSFCVVSVAQDAGQAAEEEKVLTAVAEKMLKKISVDFRDTPIDDVIITIGKQVDLDIVKGPDVTGNVTATLTDVPLEEALNHILTAYGAGFVASENMIRIVPASQLTEETEKMVSKVYRIVYADVKEVEKVLAKAISKRGTISANPGTSNIMITDTESKIAAIDIFVEEMDRRTAQILVEARIYDISNTDSLDVGVEWNAGRRTNWDADPTLDSDITYSRRGSDRYEKSRTDPFLLNSFGSGINKATSTTSLLNIGILNEHINIDALVTAAQEKGAAKLLANPRILVLDNMTASFKAITEIPYQRLQQGGYQSFGTTEFKEVGVQLEVTPHLAKDGMIRLHILPVFSVQSGNIPIPLETSGTGSGGTIRTSPQPIVDRREADTTTLVQDGDTVVIGGLRKEEIITEQSKVPILGDIPILGMLFRFEGEERRSSELVVFITPRVIEQSVLTETEAAYLEATEFTGPKLPTTKIDPETKKLK
ncbi:secretin N-terminal domain-containing protein [Planctomycetota bacterium]